MVEPEDTETALIVYTAIFGDYDQPVRLTNEPGVEYYLLSYEGREWSGWKPVKIDPGTGDPARDNRWAKMHPHEIFSGSKPTVYIDGHARFAPPCRPWTALPGRADVGLAAHPARYCLDCEAKHVAHRAPRAIEVVAGYAAAGLPHDFGLFRGGWVYRRANAAARRFSEAWWQEYVRAGLARDQLCLPFALWRTGVAFATVKLDRVYWSTHRIARGAH